MLKEYNLPSRERLAQFADLIGDHNPLHRNRDYALAHPMKFTDTPVLAVLLEAVTERQTTEGVKSNHLKYTGHSFKFKNPIYPTDTLKLDIEVLNINPDLATYAVNGRNKLDASPVFTSNAIFSSNYPAFVQDDSLVLCKSAETISSADLSNFYDLANLSAQDIIPWMLAASQIPAALLAGTYEKTGAYEGLSRSIDIKFHSQPALGFFQTNIHLIGEPRSLRGQGFRYTFRGITYQSKIPIVSAEIDVVHPRNLLAGS